MAIAIISTPRKLKTFILAGALRVTKHKRVLKEAGVEPRKTRRNYTDKKYINTLLSN